MKIGINQETFPQDWNFEKIFKTASECGFDGVELSLTETGILNLNSDKEDLLSIKELAKKYNIELYSVFSMLFWQYSLTSDKAEVREKAKSIVKKQLEFASFLGCDTILVVPGAVGVDFIPGCEVIDYDVAYQRTLDWLTELKTVAEEKKVSIGIENVWNKFLLSPLEMRDLIDKVGSPYVGSYFDVGNVLVNGYPEQWVKILNKRIKKVHVKDFKRSIGNIEGFVNLLAGDVDYKAVISELKKVGYDGFLTAEVPVPGDYIEYGLKDISSAMRAFTENK